MKKFLCAAMFFAFFSCATIQPKPHMYLPDCTPDEVIFIENTHKNAWVEIAEGVNVRRIELRITDKDCIMQNFSPPMFAFFTAGRKSMKALHLWKGVWIPSKDVPDKGHYNYVHLMTFEGKTVQGIYNVTADFIKTVLMKNPK